MKQQLEEIQKSSSVGMCLWTEFQNFGPTIEKVLSQDAACLLSKYVLTAFQSLKRGPELRFLKAQKFL